MPTQSVTSSINPCEAFYFLVFKPIKIIYIFGGVMMTIILAGGYVGCFVMVGLLTNSDCVNDTNYGRLSTANIVIFLALASAIVVLAHLLAMLSACKTCCSR